MTEFNCPCCGRSMGQVQDPAQIPMSPVRKTVVKALPATVEQLALAVYGSRENTPDIQHQSLRVIIGQVRKLLEPHGWTIDRSSPGRGNSKIYQLARLL